MYEVTKLIRYTQCDVDGKFFNVRWWNVWVIDGDV